MHVVQPTFTGKTPGPPTKPTGPARPAGSRRFRFAASLAAIAFALTVVLGLGSAGCDPDRAVAASDRLGSKDDTAAFAAITVDELPASLNLSAEQRTQLAAALAELRQERAALGHRFGMGGRGRGHDGDRPRGHGRRDASACMHRGDRPDCGFGPPGGGGRAEDSAAGFEPPMIGFLEKASAILSSDQFVTLAQFLAGRRLEMRPGRGGPNGPRVPFDGPFGRLAAERLGLTEAQQDQLQAVFTTHGDGMRQIRDGLDAGTMTPEQARDRAKELRLAAERSAQQILTADQWKQVQTFREARQDRRSDRRAGDQPQRVDRTTGMYIRVLGLDDGAGVPGSADHGSDHPGSPRPRGANERKGRSSRRISPTSR